MPSKTANMHIGRYIFAQITDFIPRYIVDKAMAKYKGDFHAKDLTCYNQLLHLLFGQLTACDSLRDICLCLEAHKDCLYHLGFRNTVTISSLSRANENRDYRIYEELGQYLIKHIRPLYANTPLSNVIADNAIYALDSTTISTSVKLASWALGKYSKGAVKVHTLLDLRGSIPINIHITDGKWHDNNMWAQLPIECGAIYTADKAYVDFAQMWRIQQAGAFFVMRPKNNMRFKVTRELIANLLLTVIHKRLERKWAFSNMVTMIRQMLMYYIDLYAFLEDPEGLWNTLIKEQNLAPPTSNPQLVLFA